ncbi:glycosyltransferase [Bacillus sp. FJAT-26390]|uniref:MGDG synthase family glycosyltransferase n=1 Tax=Bacillus sp. FJAT-26390 TaxID=1743142 RepID=UPI0009E5F7C5|nr:glycosyltransferase [Bacillus sp. FJAT-26390]
MIMFNNNPQPKLLILYASYGEGHLQVAHAIKSALEEQGNYRTVMVDLMAESHPWLNQVTRSFYLKSYTHMPSLYGWMYDFTRLMKHDSLFGGLLHSFGKDKIRRILRVEQPDIVMHTFPSFALPELKRRTDYHPPSYAVITDFDLHGRWVHPSIERYYVATEDLKHGLTQLGIPSSAIQVSGIPLKRGFRATTASSELYERYHLNPNKPVILIMAGAQGVMPDVSRICGGLLEDEHVQVALVCGRNLLLKDTIEKHFQAHHGASRLHVYGFIDPIHELMALADCLITKPGGVTLSEAIAAGLPIFIYRPVPGQEKQNALYLESKGAAILASKASELTEQILKLVHDPLRLTISKLSTKQLQASQTAADSIVLDMLSNTRIMERAATL